MKAVRGVLRDIIDRKLWPVALLLLAAAVAVPVYLGRASTENAAPLPPVQHADTGKTSKAAVSIEDPAAGDDRRGDVRNPFRQQHLPKEDATPSGGAANPPATTETTTPPSGGSGGAPAPQAPGGGTGTPDKPKPKPTPETETDTDPLDTHHLTIRFGRADGQMRTYKDIARLSPLPTADNPFFVFTGVLKDGKTAVFLLSSDAMATGDGHCRPSPESCQTIEVQQGDTEFFDLTLGGQPVQYQLDVVRVFRKGAKSAAANERHSVAGAAMLRSAHVTGSSAFKDAAAYRWLPDRGVLVRTPQHGSGRASANGGAAASSADAAASLPGQPVWHWQVGA